MKLLWIVLVAVGLGLAVCLGGAWYYWQRIAEPSAVIESIPEASVTFPEGWRAEEMALRLVREGIIATPSEYLQAIQSSATELAIREQYDVPETASLMGFLFPDTYRFLPSTGASAVVAKQVAAFRSRTDSLSLTYDTIILASIVEREAKHDEDRADIAGVYENRLQAGMPLQADPTVQFAKVATMEQSCADVLLIDTSTCVAFDWWPTVLRSDLQSTKSPYNTYLATGLPPEPIANPGLASLEAAATPAVHDFYYFVSDHDGKAHFGKTLTEHNVNVAKYR